MMLSLVTGTRNRKDSFLRLVRSIVDRTVVEWELIVADASDGPIIIETLPGITVLPERPRLGMSAGYNRAFREASGEWVIWLNDDCEVLSGYAERSIAYMQEHPEIGLGCIYYSDPTGGFRVNGCCYGMHYANFGIIRRELGNQIGWFDEDVCPMYGNDNSLAYRVLIAGYGVAPISGAHIHHHADEDLERAMNNMNRMIDAQRLKDKYGPYLDQMREVYDRCLLQAQTA